MAVYGEAAGDGRVARRVMTLHMLSMAAKAAGPGIVQAIPVIVKEEGVLALGEGRAGTLEGHNAAPHAHHARPGRDICGLRVGEQAHALCRGGAGQHHQVPGSPVRLPRPQWMEWTGAIRSGGPKA